MYGSEKDVARIRDSHKWHNRNRRIAAAFDLERKANGSAITTRALYLCSIMQLDQIIGKPFDKMRKKDILAYAIKKAHLRSNAEKKCIKSFFRWLYGLPRGKYPKCVEWMRFSNNYKIVLPEDMLTRDEVLALVRAADNNRDKALAFMLYETGARASELCNIRIKHVRFELADCGLGEDGKQKIFVPVFLKGKTGERVVYIQGAVPLVQQLLNEHPQGLDPEAPLFMSRKKGPISGPSVLGQILKRLSRTSNMKKRVHAHLFRHSRATELCKEMTEQELKLWFGWKGSSRMAALYTHISAHDLLEKLRKMNGIAKPSNRQNPLSPVECLSCFELNSAGSLFCRKCGCKLAAERS